VIASDVAHRLTSQLPKYTDLVSDVYDISNITTSLGVSTVTTSLPHNISVGDPISITDVDVPIPQSTLSRVLTVGTIITTIDHDLTKSIAPTITIIGADDSNFNGEFSVIQIVNRRTIKFTMDDSGATSTSNGSILSASSYIQSNNGNFQVSTVPTPTTFTFSATNAIDGSASSGKVKANTRISAAANLPRAVDSFTKQSIDKVFIFVVLGDSSASKDRSTNTDLTSNLTRSNYFRQQIQEYISIYVISNTKDEIAGRKIRDEMQTLFLAITKSIAFFRFDTNMSAAKSDPLVFVNHGIERYDGAIYIHAFNFECSTEFTFKDTSGYDDDVAFRDIDMTADQNIGTEITAIDQMNLDDEEYVP
jgi:hypothetical protein